MSNESDEEDQVGYRRPPKHTRFKKGQSGNPSGRRKQEKKIQDLLQDILNEKISIVVDGKKKKARKVEVLLRSATNKAIQGDYKYAKYLLEAAKDTQIYQEKIKTHEEWLEELGRLTDERIEDRGY